MGCQVCHSNEKDRKFSCTWCQLRICRNCSRELCTIPGRELGALLKAKEMERSEMKAAANAEFASEFRVLVEDVDTEEALDEEDGREGRGRRMSKVESRERNGGITPRE